MNPVDPNSSLRSTRPDTDAGTRRSGAADRSERVGGSGAAAAPAPVTAGESVSITQAAEELLALETQLRERPAVDSARVEQIRRAIDEGRYEIDTQRIVDSLLQSERDLR